MRVKMSKQPPPAHTASAVGPCPTVIQIVGRPALEVYPASSHHPTTPCKQCRPEDADSLLCCPQSLLSAYGLE